MVLAGLRVLLEGHTHRVRLRRDPVGADVVLVDAAHRWGPVRLPEIEAPMVVLVRDGDVLAQRTVHELAATPVPITAQAVVLVAAVEAAHRGRSQERVAREALPQAETRSVVDVTSSRAPIHTLSNREEQVLAGVCAGLSNHDIAGELFLSINSVKTYIRSAYRKMGVSRRGQAVVWGMSRGYGAETAPGAADLTPRVATPEGARSRPPWL